MRPSRTMPLLLRHELRALRRSRRAHVLGALTLLLLLVAAVTSGSYVRQAEGMRRAAAAHTRAQWDALGPYNPHNAAHFGSFAFKPVAALGMVDAGVDAFTGNVLRLEGHVQHAPTYGAAAQQGVLIRFGRLDPALVLHTLVPLLMVFVGFGIVSAEREAGRLALLVLHGGGARSVLWSKVLTLWGLGVVVLISGALVPLLYAAVGTPLPWSPDVWRRVALAFGGYGLWYFVVALVIGLTSALARQSRDALVALLSLWVAGCVVAPRLLAQVAAQRYPLPSRVVFERAMRDDREKGLDGHAAGDVRQQALRDSVLKAYGVRTVSELPVNFDGILMQADEEYGNAVWDKHFGALERRLLEQQQLQRRLAVVNPWLAIKAVSAAAAGTDLAHALDFQHQGEAYRRTLVAALNREHAFGGSKTDDWEWTAPATFFRSQPDFVYRPPSLSALPTGHGQALAALGIWSLLLAGAMMVLAPRAMRPVR